jgi:hypothetical protein
MKLAVAVVSCAVEWVRARPFQSALRNASTTCYIPAEEFMPLLIVILALLVPRVTIALLWLFSDWFTGLFSNALFGILGFIFLPTALLWYSVVQHWMGGHWGILAVAGMVVALVIDIFPMRKRRAVEEATA